MELWFWAAVIATGFLGFANFVFKIAAKREYNGSLLTFWGAVVTTVPIIFITLFFSGFEKIIWWAFFVAALSGFLGSLNNISKVLALQYIDTTIYYPLFKLLSPIFAICFGIVFFSESFSYIEWVGLTLGVLVPLLLINTSEGGRQNNLWKGLALVVFTAVMAAAGAALIKFATQLWPDALWVLTSQALGLLGGSVLALLYNFREYVTSSSWWISQEKSLIFWACARSILMTLGIFLINYAYINGGSLAVVHTITSMYILIPIILAIIFYNEHWNIQKVAAIVLSVGALALLG